MNTKMKMRMLSLLLSFVMLVGLMPTTVWATSVGAEESYALSITNKPGTTFVLSQGEYTSDVCDLWKEVESDGTGELKFDQSFSININDAVEAYNNYIDTQYPDGDREHYKALEDNNNGAIFYVQARVLINDYKYQFSSKASYEYAPYGLDGEYNEGCGEWDISSYYDDLSDFFTMSKDGGVLNLSLDGTVKEIYEALKEQDETLGDVTINNLEFELRVSCEVEYRGSYGSTNYTELSFEAISHSLYDKHIFESASEYDNLSVIPITAPLTVNVAPAYEGCYEPVKTEYNWYYEFIKEGYDTDEDSTRYGYFEKDESKESDVLTETAPSGTVYGLAYGTFDSGENNSIMLSDILNEDNKDFIYSFVGEKPSELGGKGQILIQCAVTLTFEDGKQWVVYITKADYMSRLIIPCMHACTVCGLCTVTDEMLPCNFDQMSYDISNVCICEEPSVPEFSYETVHEEETTIESTDTTVKVVVEKIEVEETPTHSFIINTTEAVGVDNVIGLYNINVFDEEGYPYTLNRYYDEGEELTVSVPVSMEEALALQSGEAALYHILADGTAEEVEGVTVVIDGESATMTFTSDSFSPYVVARTATTYTVTVTGGTASPAGPNAEGTEVTVTADPDPEGKKFKEWQIEGLSTTTSESRSIFFYMPANNVTITAIYEDANIIIESANATITEPVVGANPDFNIVSADESKYTVTVVKWNLLDGSSYPVLTAGDKFVRGESYQLDVKFVANPGYEFSDSCVYNVNGVPSAAYSLTKGERRCYFDVYEIIDTINVKGVVAPVAGATPDVSGITSDTDGIKVIDVKWRDKDGYAFEEDQFVAGEKYILWLKYETESDYKVADDAEVTFNISDSNILDKEITHPIIKMTYEVPAVAATTYTVTVTGGTASPAGPNAEGTEVTVTATPPANMGFKQWNGLDGVTFVDDTNKQSATATFKMPARAVEATAVYGINNVIATATGNIKPVLGNNAETNPTFTYNFPELTTRYNSCWRYSSDGEAFEYAGYIAGTENFCVGYWRFDLSVDLNGLSISTPCTVTVNGTKWQFVPSVRLTAESPVYYLDAEGNVSVVMFEIDGVTATCASMPESLAAEDTLPHLTFTPTPSQAVVRGDGTWQKKSGDTWVNVSGAAQAGNTYRYKTLMHIDSSTTTHTFTNDVTLKVNGTPWTVDYTTMQETGTSSVSVMVYSPEITVPKATVNTINIKGITAPVAGEAPVVTGITTDTAGITLTNIQWQNGSSVLNSTNKFEAGQTYNLWIRYAVSEGYEISDDVTVTSDLDNSTYDIDTARRIVHIWYTVPAAPKYTATVTGGGTVEGKTSVTTEAGTRLQLRAPEVSGKRFISWSGLDGITLYGDNAKVTDPILGFIMPAKNLTVTANYQDAVEITTINIKGITKPLAGANPVNFGVTTDTTGLSVKEVIWYFDRTPSTNVPHDYEFQLGDKLYLLVFLDVADGYTFADPVTITADLEYTAAYRGLTYGTVYLEYTVTEEMPTTYTVSFAANGGTSTMADVTGVSGEYELPACIFTAPSGQKFKAWSVDGVEKAVGEKITVSANTTVTAVWEDIPAAKTPIDTVNISDLAKPVVGEMPDNSITVTGTGVTVDDEGSYWGRFDSSSGFSPYYSDGTTAVDSVLFRNSETYLFQLYLNAAAGYEFTADSKFYFASELLPAPDITDLSKSFAMVNPSDSTQAVIYINMNDIAHIHVPGDWDFNDTHHWRKCTASGCDAGADVSRLPDYAEHSFVNGLCTCGAHKHNWSADWSVNGTHHWHECSANGCSITDNSGKDGYAAHDFTTGACVCGVENVITSIGISGITAPVAGETPINSASVDKVGAEVDEENTFWVRYDVPTGRTSDTYADGTSVHDTPFRDREIYLLQITIKPKTGYSFTADTKLLYGGTELSAPDAANPTASCGAIAPDCSMAKALINPTGASAPLTYTVSFVANGGTGTMANVTVESGAEYTLPANGFTAPAGKQFKSWSVGGSEKAVGEKITVTANTTVKAVWENIPVTYYTVTFDSNGGSAVAAQTIAAGQKAVKPADPVKNGYIFKGWNLDGSTYNFNAAVNRNITLVAVWEEDNSFMDDWYWALIMLYSQKFDITATASAGGEIAPEGVTKVQYSGNITYTITPDAGYAIKAVFVDGKDVGAVSAYTFKNVTKKHTIHALFEQINPYTDVKAGDWFYDDVLYVTAMGLMEGTGNGKFSPEITTDRAMLVTVLWRLEGCPVVDSPVDFFDVADGLWYSVAIDWASAYGIVNGYGDGRFGPTDQITREQIAAILNRYAAYKSWTDGTALPMLAQYKCSEWAESNVIWAEDYGLLDGLGVDVSDMTAKASRAELAAYLHKFMKNIVE